MEQRGNGSPDMLRRQRKMLLFLPLIVAPLLLVAFYGLGGGKGVVGLSAPARKGLNMRLPDARLGLKKKVLNKLDIYAQADQDSVKLAERRKQDPYYNNGGAGKLGWMNRGRDTALSIGRTGGVGLGSGSGHTDMQADELLKKLDLLKGVLNRQAVAQPPGMGPAPSSALSNGAATRDLRSYSSSGLTAPVPEVHNGLPVVSRADPDLEKLDVMLDKILRIQHPLEGRREDTVGPPGSRPLALLTGVRKEDIIRTLPVAAGGGSDTLVKRLASGERLPGPGSEKDTEEVIPGPGFMDLDSDAGATSNAVADNAVEAVVARDQTLVSGETVMLRLSEETLINGVKIPAGNMLSGKASLSGERLMVTISSIRVGNSLVPVSLEVVDLDGIPGIRMPGSINRDAGKESADEAINTIGMTSVDPGLGAQVASAGLQTARSLMSRKIKLVRVSLKAGYKVLLRNVKNNR